MSEGGIATSFKNWLKDESLDRAAGIEPTHPGHSVHDNPRWSGVGKGDGSRVSNKELFEKRKTEIYGEKRKRLDVSKSAKVGRKWIHTVHTPDGVKKMTDEEHDEYERQQSACY